VCDGWSGSGVSLWQYRVPDQSGELSKSFASDLHSHGQEARKIRVLKQIESAKELQNLKTAIERSESSQIREDRSFDRVPVSSWSDASGRVVLLGDGNNFPTTPHICLSIDSKEQYCMN